MTDRTINKIISKSPNLQESLLDLTSDSVSPGNLLLNETAHNNEGEGIVGMMPEGGTSDYDALNNRPQINSNLLTGNKTGSQLGLQNRVLASTLNIGGQTVTEVEEALESLAGISKPMTGATSSAAGEGGFVPSPSAGDENKALFGDGTWKPVSGGGGGHTILDEDGNTYPQRSKLQFEGCEVTDDSTNDITKIKAEGGVTDVKGNAESDYRTGNVNLTPSNIGAVDIEDYEEDIGTTDISSIGSTVTGAISNLYSSNRRIRKDITSQLTNLPTAVEEQNLGKYGYTIGDYFTGASGYTYTLADMNTFKGTTTSYCITGNHLGIVVATHATSKWHTGSASSVGYNGSTLHSYLKGTVLTNIKSDLTALFGDWNSHLLAHAKLLTIATAAWSWQADQYISALTCTQVDSGSQWNANGYQEGEASKSLELFRKYKWTEIFGNEYVWLRNISNCDTSAGFACHASRNGSLHGNISVTTDNYVAGLIIFN